MSTESSNEPARRTERGALELVIEPEPKDLGAFAVRRALPSPERQRVGPFIFFDHMGPAELGAGQGMDVRAHPHIGIATVTYLFEGQIMHRDSLGFAQPIEPGAVNWMTAGRGIVHSERSPPELMDVVTPLHGIQTWVALPQALEETEPDFRHYPAEAIPVVEQEKASIRLIAGSAFGATSPVQTASETFYAAAEMAPDATVDMPMDIEERAVYVVSGNVAIDRTVVQSGTMAVLAAKARVQLRAADASRVMLLGGAALPGDRTLWWNFVSSRAERIEQAKADWREGRFGPVPGEAEFIPLPEE